MISSRRHIHSRGNGSVALLYVQNTILWEKRRRNSKEEEDEEKNNNDCYISQEHNKEVKNEY